MDLTRSTPASHHHDVPVLYENTPNSHSSGHAHQVHPSSVLFREIHKNAWLRRLPNVDKRSNVSNKKNEKVWTVFCIHDDMHPFLEFYHDQEAAMEHKPQWFVCLSAVLHISPTIIAQDQECEFVVTLPSDIVRLAAPSWDTMMEWVEAIRSKLTEMKILSPQENVYSRMPEAKPPLLPTRDPNSPLPPPPLGPSALVPGVEPVRMDSAEAILATAEITETATAPTTTVTVSGASVAVVACPTPSVSERRQSPQQPTTSSQGPTVITATSSSPEQSDTSVTPTNPLIGTNLQRTASSFNFVRDSLPNDEGTTVSTAGPGRAQTAMSPSTPGSRRRPSGSSQVSSPAAAPAAVPQLPSPAAMSSPPRLWHQLSQAVSTVLSARSEPARVSVASTTSGSDSGTGTGSGSGSDLEASSSSSIYEQVFPNASGDLLPEETRHRPVLPQLSSPPGGQVPFLELPRRRRRTSSGSEQVSGPRSRQQLPVPTNQHPVAEAERRLQPAPHPFRNVTDTTEVSSSSVSRITLREQQVLQLRREMLHAGGVRMQLRRKDCVNSIALVDVFGAVWVAGWKQRECPMLYNALHIGDQLLSTAGTPVSTAAEAQRIIRSCADSLYVELVIRRLPFGRVFALRRDVDGQVLGIKLEGGSGEIRDVAPHSPAARAGLSSKAPTCDGLSLTSWNLTEVNGRPLNLFFKDGEVRDRLNAVGTDISILVQPLDLIKQIRKQLRTIRGYKDYIVQ